jgi:seryl-tRNA synthetase
MNLVGKIFTVLIFVMSLCFAMFAVAVYATHKNWMHVVDTPAEIATTARPTGLSQQLEVERKRNEELRTERDKALRERDAAEHAALQVRAKLETEVDQLQQERTRLEAINDDLDKKAREAIAAMQATQQTLAALRTEVDGLRTDIRQARADKDQHLKEVVRLTDELHQAANELVRLKEVNASVSQQYARALEVLRKFGLKPEPELYADQPPMLDGIVLAVQAGGLVEISLGEDDGLVKGHRMEVFRVTGGRNVYVGRIEVLRTAPDKAVCRVIPELMQSHVQQGDRVATRLD